MADSHSRKFPQLHLVSKTESFSKFSIQNEEKLISDDLDLFEGGFIQNIIDG